MFPDTDLNDFRSASVRGLVGLRLSVWFCQLYPFDPVGPRLAKLQLSEASTSPLAFASQSLRVKCNDGRCYGTPKSHNIINATGNFPRSLVSISLACVRESGGCSGDWGRLVPRTLSPPCSSAPALRSWIHRTPVN